MVLTVVMNRHKNIDTAYSDHSEDHAIIIDSEYQDHARQQCIKNMNKK